MQHPDEGTIHAWLDGALDRETALQLEVHVGACRDCAAAVAEARGLIAASSRILASLDDVPAGVIPSRAGQGTTGDALATLRARRAAERAARRRPWWGTPRFAAAAALLIVAAGSVTVLQRAGSRSASPDGAVALAPPNAKVAPSAPAADSTTVSTAVTTAATTAGDRANEPAPPLAERRMADARLARKEGAGAAERRDEADVAPAGRRPAPEPAVVASAAEQSRRETAPPARPGEAPRAAAPAQTLPPQNAAAQNASAPLPVTSPQAPQRAGQSLAGATTTGATTSQAASDAAKQLAGRSRQSLEPAPRAFSAAVERKAAQPIDAFELLVAGCYEISTAGARDAAAGLPARLALDSTVTRVSGDSTWRRARSLDAASRDGGGLQWRRVDAQQVEIEGPTLAGLRTRIELSADPGASVGNAISTTRARARRIECPR